MTGESLFYLSIGLILVSCKDSSLKTKALENPLVIEYVSNIYEPVSNGQFKASIHYKDKVWYQDSMAIESVSKIKLLTDSTGTTQDLQLLYYRFSDLRTNSVYEYKNFSDTSQLIRGYSYKDTTIPIINGWNFKFKRKWDYNERPQTLSDTIMDAISYKRIKLIRGPQTDINEAICYFRCDKDLKVFVLDSFLSKAVGCPLVKVVNFQISNKHIGISAEVVFLANEFTFEEQRVFAKWKSYAKEHPVIN